MKKNNIITIVLILIFIIITLINIKVYLNIQNNTITLKKIQDIIDFNNKFDGQYYKDMAFYKETNNITYYKVKNCVDEYYLALNRVGAGVANAEDEEEMYVYNYQSNKLLNIFGEEYVKNNNLDINNISNMFSNIQIGKIICNKILSYNFEDNRAIYFVNGTNITNESNKNSFTLIVVIDNNENCFSIYPEDYLKEKGLDKLKEGDKLTKKLEKIVDIKSNEYNILQNNNYISDEEIIKNYYSLYSFYLQQDIETAYNLLDSEYKTKKFNSIQDFKEFIDKKYNNKLGGLQGYKVTYKANYKQYIVVDNRDNYYIFREIAPMEYTIILDTYTIDISEFVEKYESSDTQTKVALNIQKIVDALNNKDYRYVYSKLADEFKANYFANEEAFIKYAEETFDVENTIDFLQYTEATNLCTYKITLKGKSKEVTKTIIMKLEEGTDFVMSFNVE